MEEKLAEQKKEEAAVAEVSTTPYEHTEHNAQHTMDRAGAGLCHSVPPNPPKSAAIPDRCGRTTV